MNKKGGERLVSEQLVYIIIFVVVLITIFVIYSILSGKGSAALDYITNMLRFGR
ncbi:MAG: hypothetical protein Q8Q31_01380 [Nanoarchaeota archaeon]|nr:hypothetical protein [Nanoarchaeota archaeon]